MKSYKNGASSVVRPENLSETVSKIINSIILSKFKYFDTKEELFNEAYCACFEYVAKNSKERSVVGIIYKRAYGAICDYINKNQSLVKITKNKSSKNYLYKYQSEDNDSLTEGDILVKNAKDKIDFSEETSVYNLIDNSIYSDPFEKLSEEEDHKNNYSLAIKIEEFVKSDFSKRDQYIFDNRVKGNLKLKEVADGLNISTQRVSYIEKQICFKLKDKFNLHQIGAMCNN